jgi:ankyrin repeat protein
MVKWSGPVSTSVSRRVAARVGKALFVIHAADCACIAAAATHRPEREVLFPPESYFVILRVTRDSFGGAEIELRDVYTDPDFARPLTTAEARRIALDVLRLKVGADRAELVIDQPEGVALVNMFLRNYPDMTEKRIERVASKFRAASAAHRANPGADDEIRARQRAIALRRLRQDPRALSIAARHSTPNAMRLAIAAGAALDVRDEAERTAAMIAAGAGNWRVLALLIDAGAEVAVSRDRNGLTALHHAAGYGRVRAVRVLLGAGADPDARTSKGWTALALGAHANKLAIVEILLRVGAAVNTGFMMGEVWVTPLHFAAAQGNAEMVGALLRAGANPLSQGSRKSFAPLDAAIANRRGSVIRLLVEAGADLAARGWSDSSTPEFAAEVARPDPYL